MRVKNLHPFLFILLFSFSARYCFSQGKYCIQLTAGNKFFLHPTTPFSSLAPGFELNFYGTNNYDASAAINTFMQVGLLYNKAYQQYSISTKTNGAVSVNTYTTKITEILFNISYGWEYKHDAHSLYLSLGLLEGPTYAETDELYINNSAQLGSGTDNNRNFIQFYFTGGGLYGYDLTNKITLLAGARFSAYLFEDDTGALGMKEDRVWFNYAPCKTSLYGGLQVKIGR
ncbi:MAG TPA: hypothetical protein VNY73_06355 [Bacteroidia bacterium]|jgi:hypothetical protein|nr:hypothetical protein [Bacteroidia bacterium]